MSIDTYEFGQLIRDLRRQRGLKLVAVAKWVPVSTLNAIENGRMLPSITVLDDITKAFDMPVGALDLALLSVVRGHEKRTELVKRLTATNPMGGFEVQRTLRWTAKRSELPASERIHATTELAHLLARRGAVRRAVWMMEYVLGREEPLSGWLRLEVLSSLGRFYLQISKPEEAIGPLLEAIRLRPHNDAWESAMSNLGLSWWLVGQYENAFTQWTRALSSVQYPERLGNVHFGLGSVFLRQNDIPTAVNHYYLALDTYQSNGISVSHQIRALNNILACQIQIQDWAGAERTVELGNVIVDGCDEEYRGEWLATQAELAWVQGRNDEAVNLIDQAKTMIGSSLVMSWFTTRLLELRMSSPSADAFRQVVEDIERHGKSLTDWKLRTSLSLVLVHVMMQKGRVEDATNRIGLLSASFPLIG